MRLGASIFPLVLLPAVSAWADIHLCDNVWTNRECSVGQEARLAEKPYREPDQTQQLADRKKFMLNELDLRRLRVTREQKINFEIESARAACLVPQTSLADCQKAITEANEQLDKRVASAAIQHPQPPQQQDSSSQTTVVTVIDNTYLDRGRGYRHHDHDYHHHDANTNAGVGISAGINSPNSSIGITAGVGSGAPRPHRSDRQTEVITDTPAKRVSKPAQKSMSGEAKALR